MQASQMCSAHMVLKCPLCAPVAANPVPIVSAVVDAPSSSQSEQKAEAVVYAAKNPELSDPSALTAQKLAQACETVKTIKENVDMFMARLAAAQQKLAEATAERDKLKSELIESLGGKSV